MREERVTFELGLLDLCERTGLPVFGICGGFQTMNVYRGGSLIQDLPTLAKGPVVHQGADHPVRLSLPWPEEGGEEKSQVLVNSFHHQGVDRLGKNLDILALSPDDRLVEGVFDRSHPFFVGVQWHPERMDPTNALSRTLRSAFLNACKEARAARP